MPMLLLHTVGELLNPQRVLLALPPPRYGRHNIRLHLALLHRNQRRKGINYQNHQPARMPVASILTQTIESSLSCYIFP